MYFVLVEEEAAAVTLAILVVLREEQEHFMYMKEGMVAVEGMELSITMVLLELEDLVVVVYA